MRRIIPNSSGPVQPPLVRELQVEVGDGHVRRLGTGSIVLLEDLTGQGHRTRVIGDEPVVGVFLQVP